jgi:hypothetical protein
MQDNYREDGITTVTDNIEIIDMSIWLWTQLESRIRFSFLRTGSGSSIFKISAQFFILPSVFSYFSTGSSSVSHFVLFLWFQPPAWCPRERRRMPRPALWWLTHRRTQGWRTGGLVSSPRKVHTTKYRTIPYRNVP